MKILINASITEFLSNPTLLGYYSERTLLAIYELLQDEYFNSSTLRLLESKNLISITVKPERINEQWTGYIIEEVNLM